MRVAVLGPLIATGPAGGDEIHLAPRDRVVLAALAAWPTDTLSAERLADALWGDHPPASSSKIVQGCVSRIRRQLGPDSVVTTPHGYRLALSTDEVDARRFEWLCRRGREMLELDQPDRAASMLIEALGLWRGPALIEVEEWARSAAERLERLRRDAEELRIDAAVRAGQWREVLTLAREFVDAEPLRERRWLLLAQAQSLAGTRADALATLQEARMTLGRELGLDPGPELIELERALLRQEQRPRPDVATEPAVASPVCPYPGLLAYDVDDADMFFGRDAHVAACMRKLAAAGVVVVVGPSGSGKSSLVRAGLLAGFKRDGRPIVVIRPGTHPMDALTTLRTGASRSVLAVDQCEEVITQCQDRIERDRFFAALVEHAESTSLVVALRADHVGAVSAHQGFAGLIERGLHLLGVMNEADLRIAVEGPARRAGLLLEPGLVDLLIRDVGGEPGALPLMSHSLRRTWQRREGRTLTVAGYVEGGGVHEALTQSAEEIFATLSSPAREGARQLFLRLVTVNDDGAVARHRAPYPGLLSLQHDEQEMAAVIEAFARARLLSLDRDPQSQVATVQIAHEALLTRWARLQVWLDESREDLRTARQLAVATHDWVEADRQDSFLAGGTRLNRFEAWQDRSTLATTTDERAFLRSSLEHRSRLAAQEHARQARELTLERRAKRRLLALVAILATAGLVASGLTVVAAAQQRRAEWEARLTQVQDLSAAAVANLTVDPERSILLALRAVDLTRSVDGSVRPEAYQALHLAVGASRVLLRVPDAGGSLDWSPNGTVFATEGPEDTGQFHVRSAMTGALTQAIPGHGTDVNDVAFSADAATLATTGDDGLAKLWATATWSPRLTVDGPGDQVFKPTFSGDSRLLAAIWHSKTTGKGTVRLIDTQTGRSRDLFTGVPNTIALNHDGTRLAAARQDPAMTQILDVATGRALLTLTGHHNLILSVTFSPNGRWLATTGLEGTTRIWDATSGQPRAVLFGHSGPVNTAVWNPDSSRVATGSLDGTAKLWEVGDGGGRDLLSLSAHEMRNGIYDLAFSPDGERLLASDEGFRAVRIWDVSRGGDTEVATLPAAWQWIGSPTFTPDGTSVLAGGLDGTAVIWDLASQKTTLRIRSDAGITDPSAPALGPAYPSLTVPVAGPDGTLSVWDAATRRRLLTAPAGAVLLAVSPDGRLLAIGDGQGHTRIFDRTGTVVGQVHEEPGFRTVGARFGADGRLLAIGRLPTDRVDAAKQRVTIWDWAQRRVMQTIHTPADVAAFDRSGTRVVSVSARPAIWDLRTGQEIAVLAAHAGRIFDAVFSPDGSKVATAGFDSVVRLWDARSGRELLSLRGHTAGVDSVAFSPDGSRLASVGWDDTLRVWELDLDRLIAIARRELTRNFTEEECRQYLRLAQCP